MLRQRRKTNQKIVVVLEGIKACIENTGVAPLSLAMHDVVGPEDQVLVLTLLYWNIINPVPPAVAATAGPSTESNDDKNEFNIQICDALINPNIKFLCHEISQRKETYTKVFKPFYLTCETYGVSIFVIQ
ncbi:hypothetical protein PanWU01x14_113400 [Parasponia andersonii]|uniref:Uncharacterized protein n=1 Tax=Parasponia andersonii TaxID=3476 RepID=A0A2P5CXU9_PARAD|nr:hypothetical protein PanWU01x14_113400 [Parasponia andersonii]